MSLFATILLASVVQSTAMNLEFKRFTQADGFPMVAISGLAQDADGNIWISNNESGAVYKFNGFDISRIPAIKAGRILISKSNDIYYSEGGQIVRLSGKKKLTIPLQLTSPQWKYRILEQQDGQLFISSPLANYRYDPVSCSLKVADDIDIKEYISASAIDGDNLFLATDKGKVYRKGPDGTVLLQTFVDKITNLLPTKDGRLLVGTPSYGLWLTECTPNGTKECLMEGNCTCICLGNEDDVWIGTNTGLFIYDLGKAELHKVRRSDSDPFSLPHYSVRQMFRDNQGGIWIGTQYGGVCYWNPRRSNATRLTGGTDQYHLCNSVASQIVETEDGRILIGTNGGLNIFDPTSGTVSHHLLSDKDGYDDIKAILPIGRGRYLIGYYKSGLQLFNLGDGSFRHLTSPRSVYRILPDGDGVYLLGTEERLQRYHMSSNTYATQNMRPGLLLYRDSKGRVWQGGNTTVCISDTLTLVVPAINCLLETRSGHFLIGSDNGLFIFEDGKTEISRCSVPGLEDGIAINGMEQDSNGKIWLGTVKGLFMIDEDYSKCLRFSAADGLATDYMYKYSHCRLSNGDLCFGGIGGVSIFSPEKMARVRPDCPAPVIASIKVHGEEYIPEDSCRKVTFKHSENNFKFTFSTPDYISQGNNLFRYRLEGFDSKWYQCSDDRSASYSNLPKGNYTLMVECSRNGESWTSIRRPLKFKVKPVWFLSTVAIILEMLLLMGIVTSAFLMMMRRKEIRNEEEMKALEEKYSKEISRMKALKYINASPRGMAGTGRLIKEIDESDEHFLTRAITIVENNLSNEKFNIDAMASQMGISRMKLYTEMKRITGGSAIDLIHKIRFTEACRLLKESDKTASEIAYETGFSSPIYFSESFKKAFGCTPKEYARMNRK